MRNFAAVTAVAVAAAFLLAGALPADAKSKSHPSNATNQRAWGSGIERNPWDYPNCFVWSPLHRYWVWICGPPYPTEMPHR